MWTMKMRCSTCKSDQVSLGSVLVDVPNSVVIEILCGSCSGQDVFTTVLQEGQLFIQWTKGADI